jgi:hypothetical protein
MGDKDKVFVVEQCWIDGKIVSIEIWAGGDYRLPILDSKFHFLESEPTENVS